MFGDQSLPAPERVRFYHPDLEQFYLIINRFREYCADHTSIINVAVLMDEHLWYNFCTYFLRVYMITVHWDVYRNFNVDVGQATLSKLRPVLSQPIPEFVLNVCREICRPMVSADGFIWYPLFSRVSYNVLPANTIVRNGIPVGAPDAFLARLQIQWYPPIAAGIIHYYAGQKYAVNIKREGLEPCKMSVLAWWSTPLQPNDVIGTVTEHVDPNDTSKDVVHDVTPSSCSQLLVTQVLSLETLGAMLSTLQSAGQCFIDDFNPESETDMIRDSAFRMLQHFVLQVPSDPWIRYTIAPYDWNMFWPPVQLFGHDVYRGDIPIAVTTWQMEFVFPNQGFRDYFGHNFYINRFLTQLDEDYNNFHFPSFGSSATPSDRPIGTGPTRRKRRGNRQQRAKGKKHDTPYGNDDKDVGDI